MPLITDPTRRIRPTTNCPTRNASMISHETIFIPICFSFVINYRWGNHSKRRLSLRSAHTPMTIPVRIVQYVNILVRRLLYCAMSQPNMPIPGCSNVAAREPRQVTPKGLFVTIGPWSTGVVTSSVEMSMDLL